MALEALLHASTAPSKAFHESLKASEASSCSFLPSRNAQGLRLHQRGISSLHLSLRKVVCCQAIAPLVRQECIGMNSGNLGQQSFFPDRWMEDCVHDIVRNINEAPFVHMLFDSKDHSASVTSQRQKVMRSDNWTIEDNWKEVKDTVTRSSPDGMILVHHLDDGATDGYSLGDGSSAGHTTITNMEGSKRKECSRGTDFWGVLVLGKSIARSACYILKTTSVVSSLGTCTQFSVTKAKCFGPSWQDQVRNGWLLNADSVEHGN